MAVAAFGNSSLAVTSTGQLFGFGVNYFGQLGVTNNAGTANPNSVPILVPMPGGAKIETVARGPSATHAFAVVSNLAVTTTALGDGRVGTPYTQTVTATGGVSPYSWTATGLPAGLAISGDGKITGTPTRAGIAKAALTVTDAGGITASTVLPIMIAAASSTTTTTGGQTTGNGSHPSAAALKASLRLQLAPHGASARIGALTGSGDYALAFRALAAGKVTISWYRPASAHHARVLVARGSGTLRAGAGALAIKLTAKGRRLLRGAHQMRLSGRGTFVEGGGAGTRVTAKRTFTVTR